MSQEVWLRPNRRILAFGILILSLSLAGSVGAIVLASNVAIFAGGWTVAALSLLLLLYMIRSYLRPRLAYDAGHLLVYLGSARPHRVPIEVVECFFLGQGPSLLPAPALSSESDSPESSTIVVRLAESAEQWKHVEVTPSLGLWCDGYITIRGTWCEPINADRMKQLNHRLVETHREQRKQNMETV